MYEFAPLGSSLIYVLLRRQAFGGKRTGPFAFERISKIVRLTAMWIPGALLRREPATFKTHVPGQVRLIQRTIRDAAAAGVLSKSTAKHGFPRFFAKSIVSCDPPSGFP